MRVVLFSFLILLPILSLPQAGLGAAADIDPCTLAAPERIYAAFPELKTMEKQVVGSTATCNFLDKYDIPALIITVGKSGKAGAEKELSFFGSGYSIKDVPGLGDDAAIAIQQANPAFGLKEGIAALVVIKGQTSLTISPVRVNCSSIQDEQLKLTELATEMINKL